MSENKGTGKFFLGALFGAVAGAIAGVVLAPKSGKETREDLKKASDQAVKDVKKSGHCIFARGKKALKNLSDEAEDEAEKIEEDVQEKVDEIEEAIDKKTGASKKEK